MKISVTIPDGSDLKARLLAFNKHERTALIKMALSKWFESDIIPKSAQVVARPADTEKPALISTRSPNVMGDYI
jgi:hypothetical protein